MMYHDVSSKHDVSMPLIYKIPEHQKHRLTKFHPNRWTAKSLLRCTSRDLQPPEGRTRLEAANWSLGPAKSRSS